MSLRTTVFCELACQHRLPISAGSFSPPQIAGAVSDVTGDDRDWLPILVSLPTDRPTPIYHPVTTRASQPLYPPWLRVQTDEPMRWWVARLCGRPYDVRSRPQQWAATGQFEFDSKFDSNSSRDWWLRRSSGVMVTTMQQCEAASEGSDSELTWGRKSTKLPSPSALSPDGPPTLGDVLTMLSPASRSGPEAPNVPPTSSHLRVSRGSVGRCCRPQASKYPGSWLPKYPTSSIALRCLTHLGIE